MYKEHPPCMHTIYNKDCVRCYHWKYTEKYKVALGGKPKDSILPPCKNLGIAIEDNFDTCKTCKGTVQLQVYECPIYKECNPNIKRTAEIVQNCKNCPNYKI